MSDELTARQRAISLRLAGRPVKYIYTALGRSETWFHKWWGRYLEAGPEGRYDRTRAHHHLTQRIPRNWRGPSSPFAAGSKPTPRRPPVTA